MDSSRSQFGLLLLFIFKIVGSFGYGLDSREYAHNCFFFCLFFFFFLFFCRFQFLVEITIFSVYVCENDSLVDASSPCPIYLTISPISRHVDDAFLEINWGPKCPNPPDLIGMYGDNPSISYVEPLYKIKPSGDSTGHIKTSVKFGKLHLPNGWQRMEAELMTPEALSTPICLPFWIASFIENKQQTIDCLKLNPTWMSLMQQIQNVSIKHLFLPGTHCSGCYEQQHLNSNVLLLKKFGFAQNVDIWTQLVFGIRFLDMSIGYVENKPNSTDIDNFWIVNENLFIAPLTKILKDVRLFVQRSNDIVIIDFSDFLIGFNHNQTCHSLFIEYLENELGDIAFRHSFNDTLESGDLTIEMMHNQNKSLLILYNDEISTIENDLIWFSWRKFSTQNLQSDEITEYISKIFSKKFQNSPVDVPWIVHGIQGISSSYSQALHLPTSRQRAEGINKIFSDLISNAWSLNANVVAFDFFLSCNLIDIAINANILKHMNNTDHVIINIDQ